MGCGTGIVVRVDRSLSYSILRGRLGSGIDNRRIWYISYDTDISYKINDSLAESQAAVRAQFSGAGINGNPRYNSDDYGREISKYIAIPITHCEFEFSIGSFRAREKKWLGLALLISSSTEKFDIVYTIKSKHSDGNLSGIITYTKQRK